VNGECDPDNPGGVVCGDGTIDDGTGTCVVQNPILCGTGTHDNGSGNCLADDVCGAGTVDDGSGNCIVSNPVVCGNGTIENGGECQPATPFGAAPAAPGVLNPFDAAPSPDGTTIFFTAVGSDNETHSLFSVPADGSAPATELARAFNAPFAIAVSSDAQTVFVADIGDEGGSVNDGNGDPINGSLFAVDVGGNDSVSRIDAVDGFAIKGMDLHNNGNTDVITFSGVDPADGVKGIFSINVGGNSVTTIAKSVLNVACLLDSDCDASSSCVGAATPVTGACVYADGTSPLSDPSGIAVDQNGNVFVADTSGAQDGNLIVLEIDTAGTITTLAEGGLRAGYPTGTALSLDESRVLVSALDDDNNAEVLVVDIATGTVTPTNVGIAGNDEAGGLHRAANTSDFAWCGVTAGTNNGIVYRVQLF